MVNLWFSMLPLFCGTCIKWSSCINDGKRVFTIEHSNHFIGFCYEFLFLLSLIYCKPQVEGKYIF